MHSDFSSHNTAKFGDPWKTLSVRGCVAPGQMTNLKRGFFNPPEAVNLETRNVSLSENNVGASVVSVASNVTNDIWAYGVVFYRAIYGLPFLHTGLFTRQSERLQLQSFSRLVNGMIVVLGRQ
jgi:hypothetical protein